MSCLFLSTIRLRSIVQEKSKINLKLNELNEQLLDIQNYASTIATGSVTMNDVANAPSSIFSRLVNFLQFSTTNAMQGAQTKFTAMSPSIAQVSTDASVQQQYSQSIFQSLYKQEMDNCIKIETKLLNAKETKIQQEINKLQTRLSMLESEEKSAESAQSQSAQKCTPQYVA